MKAIKIKVPVSLTTGLSVPSGSIATVGEFYLNVKNKESGKIPCQVPILLYKDIQSLDKSPISEVADFTQLVQGEILVIDYETKDSETVAISEISEYLTTIYGANNIEVVTI